jgi:hypothetical protein
LYLDDNSCRGVSFHDVVLTSTQIAALSDSWALIRLHVARDSHRHLTIR